MLNVPTLEIDTHSHLNLQMIGDAAVANYALNRKSNGDHFAVAFTFGVAAMLGIGACFPISGTIIYHYLQRSFILLFTSP